MHYDDVCIASKKDLSCFTVELYNNGKLLKIGSCLAANKEKGSTSSICQYSDFVKEINAKVFLGDLQAKCDMGYNAFP